MAGYAIRVSLIHAAAVSPSFSASVHALVLDGVFARTTSGAVRFHAAPIGGRHGRILSANVASVRRLLARHGLDDEDGTAVDPFAEANPVLAGWAAASVRGLAASGASWCARCGVRHDLVSPRCPRREHALVEQQVHAGLG